MEGGKERLTSLEEGGNIVCRIFFPLMLSCTSSSESRNVIVTFSTSWIARPPIVSVGCFFSFSFSSCAFPSPPPSSFFFSSSSSFFFLCSSSSSFSFFFLFHSSSFFSFSFSYASLCSLAASGSSCSGGRLEWSRVE